MALKFVVDDISSVPEGMRGEYHKGDDGNFHLQIDGDIPDVATANAKVSEFRDNNIGLMKKNQEMETKLGTFTGIDPKRYKELETKVGEFDKRNVKDPADIETRIQSAVAPLEAQLAEMQRKEQEATEALARRNLEGDLTTIGLKAGVDEKAMPDFLSRGLRVFNLEGQAMNGDSPIFSKKTAQPLTITEWAKDLLQEAPHLFKVSRGGGAQNKRTTSGDGRQIMQAGDQLEFGRNLEDIANGRMSVID